MFFPFVDSLAIMDSLVNYASEGENSNNSDDSKMPQDENITGGRASDANYDPVQMDMSEESNNNNSSDPSDSDRANTPVTVPTEVTDKAESKNRSSPSDQRRTDHENHTAHGREEQRDGRRDRADKQQQHSGSGSRSSGRRSSHEDGRSRRGDHRERDSRRPRDEERRGSRDDRRDKGNDDKDKDHHHRDERRDRDRDRGDRERRRDRDRDRERRHFRDDRSQKDRHRDDRSSYHKEKDRARSRSRSRDRAPASFRSSSYREEKGRSKLAQLEKLGIELKAPENDPALTGVPGEQHFYNPLATASQGKYAEQIQKRKLLWANKNKPDDSKMTNATSTVSTWMGTTFTHDQDGKVSAKFKRLMGIKEDLPAPATTAGAKPEILKKQEEMFNNMEQQYEVARATTHTQRGVGLGYATGGYQFPR